jgi:hypothetical protein
VTSLVGGGSQACDEELSATLKPILFKSWTAARALPNTRGTGSWTRRSTVEATSAAPPSRQHVLVTFCLLQVSVFGVAW